MRNLLLLILLFTVKAYGQTLCEKDQLKSYNPIAGTIPLAFGHLPSTDLVCDSNECGEGIQKGDILLPSEATEYYERRFEETRCQWTLADLNPVEEPGIWMNQIGGKAEIPQDNFAINDLDSVEFVSEGWARLGSYRITVNKTNGFGVPKQYTVILSKNVHNYLLRKALLRKLGYVIPPIKHVPRVRINFDSKKQKSDFIKNLSVNNAGSFDRWVLSQKDKEVIVQDIIVMEDQEFQLNLAKGYISANIFEGKRIYDSLLLPYALTEVPESINMFDWTVGRVYSDNVALQFPYAKEYNTSKDDAVWMVRRLVQLTEKDWWEIVEATSLPASVKLLLFEKLKSRRNHLAHLFQVENVNLAVDSNISNSDDLVDGKLVKEFYDGFARRFKIPDPESPLSYSEMVSFFKSKAVSTGMELLVNSLNSSRFMGTDLTQKIKDFNEQLAQNVATSMTSGESTKTPVDTFLFPTVNGNLILNREIVAGSYLGTDNLIQLVDTVGASVRVGVFGGFTGVYTKTGGKVPDGAGGSIRQYVPAELTANAQLYLNRTYAHVKPITSVQKALKYPFKNMLVPMLKSKYGHYFDSLMNTDYDKLDDDGKKKVNLATIELLERKTNEISRLYGKLDAEVSSADLVNSLEDLKTQITNEKENFLNQTAEKSLVAMYASKVSTVKQYFVKKYMTTPDCREQAKTEINKYFSIVERNIYGKDELGNDVIERVEEVICIASKKKKLYSDLANVEQMLETMSDELERHTYRLSNKEKEDDTAQVMNLLNENLTVGESIIVTDSIGGALAAGAGMNLYNVVNVRLSTKANKLVVNRLHIHRYAEDEIHVYKDLGNVNSIELAMSVTKWVPIMKITFKGSQGNGRTKFFKVKIGNVEDSYLGTPNIQRTEKLQALRKVFLTGSVSDIAQIQNPYVITHKFNENNTKLGLFVWRWNWLNTSDEMTMTNPMGDMKRAYRRNIGKTHGRDFENYAKDLVDLLVGKIFNQQFTISSFNEGNPGYTFMGKAENVITSYEGIYNDNGALDQPYIKLARIWNGWKLKKKKALEILKDIKKKYDFRFFEDDVLAQTKELFLYNINVNFFVYDKGIKFMLDLPEERVKKIWSHYQSRDMTAFSGDDILIRSGYHNFISLREKYHKYLLENDIKRLSKTAIRLVNVVEENLRIAGIAQIFGGGNNLFAVGRIDGFRVGDENGDKKAISNSFGRIGTEDIDGPLAQLKKFMGITQGEFYMSWLMGRVI